MFQILAVASVVRPAVVPCLPVPPATGWLLKQRVEHWATGVKAHHDELGIAHKSEFDAPECIVDFDSFPGSPFFKTYGVQ